MSQALVPYSNGRTPGKAIIRDARPLRVGLITSSLSHSAGGLAISVPALAAGLAALGAEPHVIGLEDPRDPAAALTWGPEVHAHSTWPPQAVGYAPGLSKTLHNLAPQVIDVQGMWTYPSLANLRHHRGTLVPYVITPRGMLDPWARARSAWKKRLARLWFEDEHLRRAACLRATADMEAEHFRSFGLKNPIAIVPNGVDTPPLLRPFREEGAVRRLLFLSRLHPKKGLPFILRAWAAVAPLRPDWELVIAGPDEVGHEADMRRLADQLRLSRIIWHPAVYGAEKDALYRSADLFVLPTHAENFGLVIAEALARGVPVITTRNAPWAGLREHRCGWWIDLSDNELVAALDDAMSRTRAELYEMGARGHAWMIRDFSWDKAAERMLEVYNWILHGGAAPPSVVLD